MRSLLFLTQESIKQILSRVKKVQKVQGRHKGVKPKQILGKSKANGNKGQCEYDQ